MKKYAKPIMSAEPINDIGEIVFLINSGWSKSTCYTTTLEGVQTTADGFPAWDFQVTATHGKYPWANESTDKADHCSQHQWFIIEFKYDIAPFITSITMDGNDVEYQTLDHKARIKMNYMQNEWDHIGSGGYVITFQGNHMYDNAWLANHLSIEDYYINDQEFRY